MHAKGTYLFSVLLVVSLFVPMLTTTAAATIWSDDFEDGNTDGWSTYGFNRTSNPIQSLPGSFSVVDGTLRAYDNEFNVAQHDSTQVYGT